MTLEDQRIADPWRTAAQDLGLHVEIPFSLLDIDDTLVEYIALVHGFGAPAGTLIYTYTADNRSVLSGVGSSRGYFVSGLNPAIYGLYDRQEFIDTLEDWGWFGEGAPPMWYTGLNPWTSP
jgi:hypothetical protein